MGFKQNLLTKKLSRPKLRDVGMSVMQTIKVPKKTNKTVVQSRVGSMLEEYNGPSLERQVAMSRVETPPQNKTKSRLSVVT